MGKITFSDRVANFISRGKYERSMQEAAAGEIGQNYFRERFWELESSLMRGVGDGWEAVRITSEGGDDFSREALRAMHRLALVMYLKNPLIKRGVKVQSNYVFGQGVSVHIDGHADAAQVWNDFWDHEDNQREFTSRHRLPQMERKLQIKGNLFLMFFVDRVYGTCQVREIDVDEFEEVLPDVTDSTKPAFYKRVYTAKILNRETGRYSTQERIEYYPDVAYNPSSKPKSIGGAPVFWDRPVMHIARERVSKIGIAPCEYFAQIDWGKAYVKFLENRATVASALSRIVLKFTSATKAGVDKSKKALATRFSGTKTPADDDAGQAAHMRDGSNVEAVNVKGATIHPDEGRRFLLMICAGFGFGETFFGDVSVGTLATAQSLDRPTELAMLENQQFWSEILEQIAKFVLRQAVQAAANPLSRRSTIQKRNGREFVVVKGEDGIYTEAKPHAEFPPLLEHDVEKQVRAIKQAATMVPLKKWGAKLVLNAIGDDHIEETLAMLPDDKKLTEWPSAPAPVDAEDKSKPDDQKNGEEIKPKAENAN